MIPRRDLPGRDEKVFRFDISEVGRNAHFCVLKTSISAAAREGSHADAGPRTAACLESWTPAPYNSKLDIRQHLDCRLLCPSLPKRTHEGWRSSLLLAGHLVSMSAHPHALQTSLQMRHMSNPESAATAFGRQPSYSMLHQGLFASPVRH